MRLVSTMLLLAVFALAVTLGFFILLALIAAAAMLAAVFYARFWWLRRKIGTNSRTPGDGITLEGEYTVAGSRKISPRDDQR